MIDPVFIDFEASSLSNASWPIEVGLAWLDGKRVITHSRLIHPRAKWPESDWHAKSEAVHNIPRRALDHADPADVIAAWLLETIGQRMLVSDAPTFDQKWLDLLLDRSWPKIEDFDRILWPAFSGQEGMIAPGRLHVAYRNRVNRAVLHRAGDDAAGLCYA